ncbi:O-methyltransferase [Candidatus Uabimicrobium amorphum]|uniref:O-methyltransferase n=1 Tax=Uabimicrobium amorphum TaxID=2596890 RepID=A0A5S9IHV8_UABAM|nr:class I SAM-dependent methyltransferase [Candidatus Uabimicrobium amorphum]BBM82109.1 O-methyltransferase [Candidatus Uabimicrobium amorphum]
MKIYIDKIKRRLLLWWLSKMKNPAANKIANAIYASIKKDLNKQEQQWVECIENLRSELQENQKQVSITDYGAGQSDSTYSDEEMYEGKVHTTTVAEICRTSSKRDIWALILFKLVREFQPNICLELGTSLGFSAAYQAAAQRINNHGQVITLEGAQALVALSQQNFTKLKLDNISVVGGKFQDTLSAAIDQANQPIDYAFIDGHHDKEATLRYFEILLPKLADKALVIFDDINWSEGMRIAWHKIVTHEQIKLSIDLNAIGICMLDSELKGKLNLRIPF